MHILFLNNHCYLPQIRGGIEVSTHELSTNLISLGINVSVAAHLNNTGLTYLFNRFKSKITGESFPSDSFLGYPVHRGWINIKSDTSNIKTLIRKINPDLVIAQATDAQLIAEIVEKLNVPAFVYIRDVEFDDPFGAFASSKPSKNSKIRYLSNSSFTAKKFYDRFEISSEVINPIVTSARYRVDPIGKSVVFINPTQVKGVDIAIEIARRRKDINFIFQESWPLGEKKKELIEKIKEFSNITLCESCSDMRNVYKKARILLVPSQWEEAWGRVVTEAQISGIPVIASDRGALPESVDIGGIIISANASIDEWVTAVSNLWDNNIIWKQYSENAINSSQRKLLKPEYLIEKLTSLMIKANV